MSCAAARIPAASPSSELAEKGLLDGLSSDYVPASLLQAVLKLHADHGIALPEAMGMVTWKVADILGLRDRGHLKPGLRADLVRFKALGPTPVIARRLVARASARFERRRATPCITRPPADSALWRFGSAMLGYDAVTGEDVPFAVPPAAIARLWAGADRASRGAMASMRR